MKNILLLLGVVLFVSCSGVKSAQRDLNSGNYDEAIRTAVTHLRKDKTNKKNIPYLAILQTSFDKAVARDQERIAFLEKERNPAYYSEIYSLYLQLSDRQDKIKPLLPLTDIRNGKKVHFQIVNYQNQIIQAKEKYVGYLYEKAENTILYSTQKADMRQAYGALKTVNNLMPNYRRVNSLMEEAYKKGVNYVYVAVVNDTRQIIPKRLEKDLLDFDTYGLNQFWTRYSSDGDSGIPYDYALELVLRDIKISPEQLREREQPLQAEIQDGYTYVKDDRGNVKKDSLGNDIKVVNYVKVSGVLREFTQYKQCQIDAVAQFIDYKTGKLLSQAPLSSGFVFENHYADYRGDKRALPKDFLPLLRNRPVPFPTAEQMVWDAGRDLKEDFKDIIYQSPWQ